MAGAGYKLFNTGDVLTAAQVNTYLMEQTVMVFADAAARTTALTGVVSEGMISYLKDTNAVEVYNGSAWVASDDPNAIQNTIVDAKGDLISASAADVPARLAVGSDGETLVCDSSTSTGLRWQGNFAAGKNKIINADCFINQRSFTSTTTNAVYTIDRWKTQGSGGSVTWSVEQFTSGAAPVAGYEAKQFLRTVTSGQSTVNDYACFRQDIEGVRTLAGETVTVSFWAKAGTGTPNIGITLQQDMGSGGSGAATLTSAVKAITTSWARYSFTVSIPSISGKTPASAGGSLNLYIFTSSGTGISGLGYAAVGVQNATIDFWGVQLEAGSVATPFTTATGTLAGELYACKRYYQKMVRDNSVAIGNSHTAGVAYCPIFFEEEMRVAPTITFATAGQTTGTITFLAANGNYPTTTGTHAANNITVNGFVIYASGYAGFTAGGITSFYSTGSSTVYTASAEL